MRRAVIVATAAVLPIVALSIVGFAPKLAANTIDCDASLSDNGHRIVLTGPIRCTQEEWIDMRVTVTQRSTGAVAEGRVRLLGSTDSQQWELTAERNGDVDFEAGEAIAVALAVTTKKGSATDAHQWLVPIELSAQ